VKERKREKAEIERNKSKIGLIWKKVF